MLELVRYIHLNPIRALSVKSMKELDYYPWSGHSIIMGKQKNDWQERKYVLSYFGKEKMKALRAYPECWGLVTGIDPEGKRGRNGA